MIDYANGIPGYPYAPIGDATTFSLSGLTVDDLGTHWKIDETNASQFGLDWDLFEDWMATPLPFLPDGMGHFNAGNITASEIAAGAIGTAQTDVPKYAIISYQLPGYRELILDRAEFTLETLAYLNPIPGRPNDQGTIFAMKVDIYATRTRPLVPEPTTCTLAALSIVTAASTYRARRVGSVNYLTIYRRAGLFPQTVSASI